MKLMVINGPNLNMLGIRQKDIYGATSYQDLCSMIHTYCMEHAIEVTIHQSNHEGDLVDWIQQAYFEEYDGIVINPGGYSHTSIAIRDAITSIAPLRVVEVHISDIEKREDFRKHTMLEDVVFDRVVGHGVKGYIEAILRLS